MAGAVRPVAASLAYAAPVVLGVALASWTTGAASPWIVMVAV
jgi:hypothetical protein